MCLLSGKQWVTALWHISRSHRAEPCVNDNDTDGPGSIPTGDAGHLRPGDKNKLMLIMLAKYILFTVEAVHLGALHAL